MSRQATKRRGRGQPSSTNGAQHTGHNGAGSVSPVRSPARPRQSPHTSPNRGAHISITNGRGEELDDYDDAASAQHTEDSDKQSLEGVPGAVMTAQAKRRVRRRKTTKINTKRRVWYMSARRLWFIIISAFVLGAGALYYLQKVYPWAFLLPPMPALPALPVLPLVPSMIPNISAITDALPSALEIQQTIMNEINKRVMNWTMAETISPGMEARAKNYTAKYPVLMIPGFVTTGLEVWEGEKCAQRYFRQRLWGTLTMLSNIILQPHCWAKHMSLDMATGLDPPGIRLRPAQGFEAADFFLPGLWVWAKLIQDLSLIGYDYRNLALMSYDWRLNLKDLEERDRYYTLLKSKIELMHQINGEKVVLISHSYGSNVMMYFFKWVESEHGGKGGKRWVDKHVHTFVNIAGPMLGVIKAMTAYMSGEMHDTAELGALENILWGRDSNVFNKKQRVQLFRTWGSLSAMLPKGGKALWGNETYAPEDDPEDSPLMCVASSEPHTEGQPSNSSSNSSNNGTNATMPPPEAQGPPDTPTGAAVCESVLQPATKHGQVIGLSNGPEGSQNWTVDDALQWLMEDDPYLATRHTEHYDFGMRLSGFEDDRPKFWTNPMSVQLPHAPSMRLVCYYGVGKPTERSYTYKLDADGKLEGIDKSVNDPWRNVSDGVLMGEGDGTVTLLSLGYHCSHLWRHKTHNPAQMQITARELLHTEGGLLGRGPESGDHVDIMGNAEMAYDILRIASGQEEDEVYGKDKYHSRILELANRVQLPSKLM